MKAVVQYPVYWGTILVTALLFNLPVSAQSLLESKLEGLDAHQAIGVANRWFDEKQAVKSFVNAREIVFEFKDGKTRRIPLPANEMMVAIAPYIQKTHT